MEDSKILDIIKATHEFKMDWYWTKVRELGEVNGLAWLIDIGMLDNQETCSVEHSLQILGGEVAERLAESDSISRNDMTREVVVTGMIRNKTEEIMNSYKSAFVCSVTACIIGLFLLFLAVVFTTLVPTFGSAAKLFFVIGGIIGLVVVIVGAEYAIRQKRLMKKAYETAANEISSELKTKLDERDEDLALLRKIDQCLELINSRF